MFTNYYTPELDIQETRLNSQN